MAVTTKVISLSLGSAGGDYCFRGQVGRQPVEISRIGFGGKLHLLKEALLALDGQVPYLALGGINFNYTLGSKQYPIPEAQQLKELLRKSTLVDGSGWKRVWDPLAIQWLIEQGWLQASQRILCTSALDRWDLCLALEAKGLRVGIGDALFALKLPLVFPNLGVFQALGRVTMPLLRHLPLAYLYPLGDRQDVQQPLWESLVNRYDVYLGDTHFLSTYGPRSYKHKLVIASTMNETFLARLQTQQAQGVVALQPILGKRVFGANVWEALALSMAGDVTDFLAAYTCEPSILL